MLKQSLGITCPWAREFAVVSFSHRALLARDGNVSPGAPLKNSYASVCAASPNSSGASSRCAGVFSYRVPSSCSGSIHRGRGDRGGLRCRAGKRTRPASTPPDYPRSRVPRRIWKLHSIPPTRIRNSPRRAALLQGCVPPGLLGALALLRLLHRRLLSCLRGRFSAAVRPFLAGFLHGSCFSRLLSRKSSIMLVRRS